MVHDSWLRRRIGAGLVVLVAVIIVSVSAALSAPQATPGPPVRGGALNVAYVSFATHIDTNASAISTVNEVAHYFYETLFDRDGQGRIRPLLVRDEQVSPDGRTVTWRLHPNIKFHDGSPFNAAAVKWNLERKIQKKQPLFDLLPIRTVDVVDDLSVRVSLTRPAPNLKATLSVKTFSMFSPSFVARVGDDAMRLQASGTGAFQVVEFRANQILRLKRNPNYWQQGLPYLDEVNYRIVPDANTRATMLGAGDVDMALGLSIPDIQRYKSSRGFKVLEGQGSQQYYITINNQKPPLNDVRVRQALNYAVDKEGIIRTVLLGAAKPATAVYLPPRVDGYAPGGSYPYSPDKARRLLDEAGWRPGAGGIRERDGRPLRLELIGRKGSQAGDFETVELVQGMLKAVGVDVRLTILETATFVQRVTKPVEQADYDMIFLSVNVFTGDAEFMFLKFLHSDSWPLTGFNRAYYGNPSVDRLIDQSLETRNLSGRDKIFYTQAVKQIVQDAPVIMLFDLLEYLPMRDTVHGVYLEPAGNNWPAKYGWKSAR